MSTDFSRYEKYFEGYKLTWASAIRIASFGRASGGVLVGCKIKKKDWTVRVSHEFERFSVNVKCANKKFVVVPLCIKMGKRF